MLESVTILCRPVGIGDLQTRIELTYACLENGIAISVEERGDQEAITLTASPFTDPAILPSITQYLTDRKGEL